MPTKAIRRIPSGLERDMKLEFSPVADQPDTIELSFSSTYPVERYFGAEILEHSRSAVDLGRVERGACPLLRNHSQDQLIGKVEKAWIDTVNQKGRAVVRFDTKSERGAEAYQQFQDGFLDNVSCWYKIKGHREDYQDGRSSPVVTITSWELVEISLVSCPEDPTVGVGRNKQTNKGQGKMPDETRYASDKQKAAIEHESMRQRTIRAMAERYAHKLPGGQQQAQEIAADAIENDVPETEARRMFWAEEQKAP